MNKTNRTNRNFDEDMPQKGLLKINNNTQNNINNQNNQENDMNITKNSNWKWINIIKQKEKLLKIR